MNLKVTLPIPPPENERLIFTRKLGRFILSSKYRKYKEYAKQLLLADSFIELPIDLSFEQQLRAEITVFLPDKRRDAHGCLKPLLDVLEGFVYVNDKWVVPQFQKFQIDENNPRVEIIFSKID